MVALSVIPPTIQLPPIAKLASSSPDSLIETLRYLRLVYNPEVRGSRRIKKVAQNVLNPFRDSNVNLGRDSEDLDLLRSDPYERTYAMRWLTALISHASVLEATGFEPSPAQAYLAAQYDVILTAASSLLAICAGTSAAGTLTRPFVFDSALGDITVIVTDAPLENQNFESVGAQTWGGACVLSELIVEQPVLFGAVPEVLNGRRLRVLELGAGTGLVSLTLRKLLEKAAIEAEIIATDFYPSVLANLRSNIVANSVPSPSLTSLTAQFLDWSTFPALASPSPPFDTTFDIILGADIIYDASHALWIKSCLQLLLRPPEVLPASPQAIFHLVIPLRPTHAMESRTIEEVFPLTTAFAAVPSGDLELVILDKEIIACEAGDGRRELEVEYGYYKIGWGIG